MGFINCTGNFGWPFALGIDISKTENYEEGQLTRFMSVEYKSDIRRDGTIEPYLQYHNYALYC
jgi:hypothetical protein